MLRSPQTLEPVGSFAPTAADLPAAAKAATAPGMSLESEIQSLMDVEGHALEKPALAIVDQAVREQHPAAFALYRTC